MARSRKSGKSLRSREHRAFCELMVRKRQEAALTQTELAQRLGKPQSYVAKYEGGERRLDVVEFLAVCRAIDTDPALLVRELTR